MMTTAKDDQEVAVKPPKVQVRSRRNRLQTRLRRLQLISEGKAPGSDFDQVTLAMRALARVHREGQRDLTRIGIRPTFVIRRVEPQGEMSDRRPPSERLPPALALASPNGIAQQLELVALFVAQAQKSRHQDGRVTFELPLETTDADALQWLDLVVPHSEHARAAVYAASRRDNRLRQVKRALDSLAGHALVELPNARASRGKYQNFRLLDEGGPRPSGSPLVYRVPSPKGPVIDLPVDFFLQGWVFVLTKSEIALWLMLRHLRHLHGHTAADTAGLTVSVTGDVRLRRYGITKDAYKGWWLLEEAGLIKATIDPNRRADGTVADFDPRNPPERHRFELLDEGLRVAAAPAVKAALAAAIDGDVVGVRKANSASILGL